MNRSPFLQMALFCTCTITILSGCVYHDQKTALLNERQYLQAMNAEENINKKELIEEHQNNENERNIILNEISDLKDEQNLLRLRLKKLYAERDREKKVHSVACGEKCQEVKKLEKEMNGLEESVKIKKSALKVM